MAKDAMSEERGPHPTDALSGLSRQNGTNGRTAGKTARPVHHTEYVNTPSGFARSGLFVPLLGGFEQVDGAVYFERETYNGYELLHVTAGKGRFRHRGRWTELHAGDGLLYDMRHPHAYRADPDDPYEMAYIVFQGGELDRLWPALFGAPCVTLPGAGMQAPYLEPLGRIFQQMTQAGSSPRPEDEPRMSALVYDMLMQALAVSRQSRAGPAGDRPASLEAGRLFLERHYAANADIRGAAAAAGLSYYHFIRQFNRYYGTAPKQYVTRLRLMQSKHLLLHTDKPIADIGEAAGFGSYNAFLNTFLQAEGCSPTAYRNMWRRPVGSRREQPQNALGD